MTPSHRIRIEVGSASANSHLRICTPLMAIDMNFVRSWAILESVSLILAIGDSLRICTVTARSSCWEDCEPEGSSASTVLRRLSSAVFSAHVTLQSTGQAITCRMPYVEASLGLNSCTPLKKDWDANWTCVKHISSAYVRCFHHSMGIWYNQHHPSRPGFDRRACSRPSGSRPSCGKVVPSSNRRFLRDLLAPWTMAHRVWVGETKDGEEGGSMNESSSIPPMS